VSRSFKIFIEILLGSTTFLNLTVFRRHSVLSVVIVDFIPSFLPPIFGLKSSNYSPMYSLQFFYFSCSCKIILSFFIHLIKHYQRYQQLSTASFTVLCKLKLSDIFWISSIFIHFPDNHSFSRYLLSNFFLYLYISPDHCRHFILIPLIWKFLEPFVAFL